MGIPNLPEDRDEDLVESLPAKTDLGRQLEKIEGLSTGDRFVMELYMNRVPVFEIAKYYSNNFNSLEYKKFLKNG